MRAWKGGDPRCPQSQELLHDLSVDVGEAEVPALEVEAEVVRDFGETLRLRRYLYFFGSYPASILFVSKRAFS